MRDISQIIEDFESGDKRRRAVALRDARAHMDGQNLTVAKITEWIEEQAKDQVVEAPTNELSYLDELAKTFERVDDQLLAGAAFLRDARIPISSESPLEALGGEITEDLLRSYITVYLDLLKAGINPYTAFTEYLGLKRNEVFSQTGEVLDPNADLDSEAVRGIAERHSTAYFDVLSSI